MTRRNVAESNWLRCEQCTHWHYVDGMAWHSRQNRPINGICVNPESDHCGHVLDRQHHICNPDHYLPLVKARWWEK